MTTPDHQPDREQRVAEAFVSLADSLVDDFDLPDFLHQLTTHCLELLNADGAGVMLADPDGGIRLVASSDETARALELFEIDGDQGPCLSAYRSGHIVEHRRLDQPDPRWARFAERAHEAGYTSTHAIPMRLRGDTIGVLNLFSHAPGPLTEPHQRLGQALADVATIALLQHRAIGTHRTLTEQLQAAFTSRVDIEQAKGLLAERLGIAPDEAFQRIRRHARRTNRKLSTLARDLITGTATLPDPDPPRTNRPRTDRPPPGANS